MIEALGYDFIRRALLAGTLVGLTCAVLAVFVVLRRMAFVGVGISHAALGGVALGLVAGVDPMIAALVFSVLVAWVIGWTSERGRISDETAIGIFFPTAMAMGVALMSRGGSYRQDLLGYLFGNILTVRSEDLVFVFVVGGVALVIVVLLFKEFLFISVDEESARAAGLPSTFLRYLLLTVLAVTIVSAIRLVGIVLVSAFLVIPAATGQVIARSMGWMVFTSVVVALAAVAGGLALSWYWNLPSGAAIVLFAAGLFFVALAASRAAAMRAGAG
ncbi:MAG: metal ABC transporter permease [Gemmatimonadota bacterium]